MIPENYKKVLITVAKKLSKNNIDWILIGSTRLALSGIDIVPNDIDLFTNKEDAFKINEILSEYEQKPVHHSKKKKFDSYYGIFKIDDVEIEVIGEAKDTPPKTKWIKSTTNPEILEIQVEDTKIPVYSLQNEYEAYKNMGRNKKANIILKHLKNKN